MNKQPPPKLPDPWLFDSEALIRELDRCREKVLEIPTNGNCNATHFAIQIAVNAIYNLTENVRYLLHLHREQQRAIRKPHQQSLSAALSQNAPAQNDNIVRLHSDTTHASNGKKFHNINSTHAKRKSFAKRRPAHYSAA